MPTAPVVVRDVGQLYQYLFTFNSLCVGGITEEQFQSHQQQLAQMLQQKGAQQNLPVSEHSHAHLSVCGA